MSIPTTVVIGAGVIGLAVARAMALAGHEVIVLEAHNAIGTQTSSRNSEVIHAGIYYPAGSLKARLCVAGKEMLYAYCAERGVEHQRLGKLIVAANAEQESKLHSIQERAKANGVNDLQPLNRTEALALEPALRCHAALFSPSTGIVNSHSLMLSLQGDLENAGGLVAFVSPVVSIDCTSVASGGRKIIRTEDGTELEADYIINAAGHGAIPLAHQTIGLQQSQIPTAYFVKGQYFTLTGKAPFQRLIYPVPQIGGLGVHLTLDLGGQAKFGPDVQWTDREDDLEVDPRHLPRFLEAIQQYWPALTAERLQPGYAGMRPNVGGPQVASPDFIVQDSTSHGISGLINLFGMESPGLTACMAIGEEVRNRLLSHT